MFYDACREAFKIRLTFSFRFSGAPVGGDHDLRDLRLFRVIVDEVLRFIEEIEDGHLTIGSRQAAFGSLPELTLVHDADLFNEKLDLAVVISKTGVGSIKLILQGSKAVPER